MAGPFVTEDPTLRAGLPERHNDDRGHQGPFRVGAFDAVAARYALAVAGGVDELALTHLDRLPGLPPRVCTAYAPAVELSPRATARLAHCRPVFEPIPTDDPAAFVDRIGSALDAAVGLASFGPTSADVVPCPRGRGQYNPRP